MSQDRKTKPLHIYLVGWSNKDPRIAYGKDRESGAGWVDLFTLRHARSAARRLSPSKRIKRVVYALVPVEWID